MKEVAHLLNAMKNDGVILDYALFGAIAQMRYTEPVATLDADVLVVLPQVDRLNLLTKIYEFCSKRGYNPEGEAIRVGGWPVQFVPVFSELTTKAVEHAELADFDGVPLRVVSADYLAVIALGVGRSKDFARVLALLESGSVSRDQISELASAHDLSDAWNRFEKRFPDET
jgi:hypothetical protein